MQEERKTRETEKEEKKEMRDRKEGNQIEKEEKERSKKFICGRPVKWSIQHTKRASRQGCQAKKGQSWP